jgi:paraquat-inducible protein A
VRCDGVLAKGSWLGPDATLVFSVTGLILAVPAVLLTFVSAGKAGAERFSFLFTGVGRLWGGGMRALAVLVLLCGGLVPIAYLGALAAASAWSRSGWPKADLPGLCRVAHGLGHWALPEVQVLAVLVALMKLGSDVDITIGPGFWCYSAMALSLLIAHRCFEFGPAAGPDGAPLCVARP